MLELVGSGGGVVSEFEAVPRTQRGAGAGDRCVAGPAYPPRHAGGATVPASCAARLDGARQGARQGGSAHWGQANDHSAAGRRSRGPAPAAGSATEATHVCQLAADRRRQVGRGGSQPRPTAQPLWDRVRAIARPALPAPQLCRLNAPPWARRPAPWRPRRCHLGAKPRGFCGGDRYARRSSQVDSRRARPLQPPSFDWRAVAGRVAQCGRRPGPRGRSGRPKGELPHAAARRMPARRPLPPSVHPAQAAITTRCVLGRGI